MLKRLFSIITISLVLTGSFFSAYNNEYPVYADTTTDEWTQVTTNEQLADAFRYYCKSRDLTIDGSLADGVTKFTTKTFQGLCKTLGIDMTALQAKIKYQTDGNSGLKYLFDREGINAYNRIFAQFLQDNNLEVGDSVNDKSLYDGKIYNDSLLFIVNLSYGSDHQASYPDATILQRGSYYQYTGETLFNTYGANSTNVNFTILGQTYTLPYATSSVTTNGNTYYNANCGGCLVYTTLPPDLYPTSQVYEAGPCIIYNRYWNQYWLGAYSYTSNGNEKYTLVRQINGFNDTNCPSVNVYVTTNNTTINNNNYEGDTVINNNGDTNNYYPDNPDTPDTPDTPDPPTIPDSGGWQDFSLPDMPNDWLIYGMEKKFPFDIPFNILFALSLLNHEPEIPKFEGDIDLQVCTWHYDIDLTPFDDIATILRKFEVLGFIIGLAILTKNLINWG